MPPRQLEDWEELQKRIFTRWVNQKLQARHLPQINDVLTDIGQENNLSNLILALTDKEMPKPAKPPQLKVRAQKVEWLEKQVEWCYKVGVPKPKLPPSAANIFDGDYSDIMGMVYNIMQKFLRFDDDDGEGGEPAGNAADALLRWCQFQTKGYKGVNVTNLKKSWADGLALCALVHKFAPDAFDFDKLSAANSSKNIETAMNAADKFFRVEKFLTPKEVGMLDDKGMLVVLSEYYYGINSWFKMQIAGKRIIKLVGFTRENDEARAEYAAKGEAILARLAAAEGYLAEVDKVTNTMVGARKNLADFNKYKSGEKRQIIGLQLEMLGVFNRLNMRLKNNKRPEFAPDASISPDAIAKRVAGLQAKEAVEPKLYAELERQIRLVETNTQHETRAAKIERFIAAKRQYLQEPLTATSSGDARKLLKHFEGFVSELAKVKSEIFPGVQKTGAYLASEKYEGIEAVQSREASIAKGFEELDAGGKKNEPVLQDNLKREVYREGIVGKVDVHKDIFERISVWANDAEAYVDKAEEVDSTQEARIQLSTLDGFDVAVKDTEDGNVARLNELGEEVRAAQYETDISEWKYEQPAALSDLEAAISKKLDAIKAKAAHKRKVLNDALTREMLRESVALHVGNHGNLFASFEAWAKTKLEYLAVKETVTSSLEARTALNVLDQFVTEKEAREAGDVAALKKLGGTIRSAKHETEFSSWKYEKPDELTAVEADADKLIAELDKASAAKREVLDDDLARELYAEETRLVAGRHVDAGVQCGQWANKKTLFMQSDVVVHSIREAEVGLSLLDAYDVEKARFTEVTVASLKRLGKDILARKYDTKHSSYVYEHPEEITEREATIDGHWATLDELSRDRRATLEKLKAREERKEALRIEYADAAGDLVRLCDDAVSVIGNEAEQRIMFGFSLKEVVAHRAELEAQDAAVNKAREDKRAEVTKVVAEMTTLVQQTTDFDRAQAEGHKEAEAAAAAEDETSPPPPQEEPEMDESVTTSPNKLRKTRFNTLTKSLKKAFTKKKRSTEMLGGLPSLFEGQAGSPWPEDKNPYSQHSVAHLDAKERELAAVQEARVAFYESELQRWRDNDAACKAFADAVTPPSATVKKLTGDLMASNGTDEAQLEAVTAAVATLDAETAKMPEYVKLAEEVSSRGVTTNPYTAITVEDVKCEIDNVHNIAKQKKPYLESLIAFKKYKGISPEQYDLMETLFKEHDADKSNSISPKELRACLFSLGEERSKVEIAGYVKQYGKKGALNFEQFRELMIVLIGDTGNKESTTESFKLIARGRDVVAKEDLTDGAPAVPADDVAFFAKEAPAKDGGFAYGPWIDAVFAR